MIKVAYIAFYIALITFVVVMWNMLGCLSPTKNADAIVEPATIAYKADTVAAGGDVEIESKVALMLAKQYGWLMALALLAPQAGYILGHRIKPVRRVIDMAKGKPPR